MPSSFRRSLPITGVAVLLLAAPAPAEISAEAAPPPHIRYDTGDARALGEELTASSPTARALVDRLEHSDLIVYVRHRPFPSFTIDGRLALLASTGRNRFVVVELACARPRIVQLVTLGHELHHAVEIADAPDVISSSTLAQHYAQIGERAAAGLTPQVYETSGAIDAGRHIRHELQAAVRRSTDERD